MRAPRNERLTSIARKSGHRFSANSDATDSASDIAEREPVRTCVLTGREGVRDGLIRLALAPADASGVHAVLPDALARAPGRGAWLGVSRAELEAGISKGRLKAGLLRSFGRHLAGAPLGIADDLPDRIEAALARAVLGRLGLELAGGRLLLGSDRIADAARAGRVAWLGHASDAGDDGVRKLDQAWRVGRAIEGSGEGGMRLPLDRAALSVALGRDNTVHLALSDAAAAARLAVPLGRLLLYHGISTPAPVPADRI